MERGTVKFFNSEKNFGFITNNSGNDIFVHGSGCVDKINKDDKVIYETQDGKKGANAINVRLDE